MKILFEKYDIENNKNKLLEDWSKVFDNIDDLFEFLEKNKYALVGEGYIGKFKIVIKDIEVYEKNDRYSENTK